jgi:hypothetical protein
MGEKEEVCRRGCGRNWIWRNFAGNGDVRQVLLFFHVEMTWLWCLAALLELPASEVFVSIGLGEEI